MKQRLVTCLVFFVLTTGIKSRPVFQTLTYSETGIDQKIAGDNIPAAAGADMTFHNFLSNTTCHFLGCRTKSFMVNEDELLENISEGESQHFIFEAPAGDSLFTSGNCTYQCLAYDCLFDFQWRRDLSTGHEFYGVISCLDEYKTRLLWPPSPPSKAPHIQFFSYN